MFRHTSGHKRYSLYQMNKEFEAIRNIENRIARFWGVLKHFSDVHPNDVSLMMSFNTYNTIITKINTAIGQYNLKPEFYTFIDRLKLIAHEAIENDDECKSDPNITELILHIDNIQGKLQSNCESDYLLYKQLMITIASHYLRNYTATGSEVSGLTGLEVILRCQPLLAQLDIFAFRLLESGECAIPLDDLQRQEKLGFVHSEDGETAAFVDESLLAYFAARYIVSCLQAELTPNQTEVIPHQQLWLGKQSIREYVSAHSSEKAYSLVWGHVQTMLRRVADKGELAACFQLWLEHPRCSDDEIADLRIKQLTNMLEKLRMKREELRKIIAKSEENDGQDCDPAKSPRLVR